MFDSQKSFYKKDHNRNSFFKEISAIQSTESFFTYLIPFSCKEHPVDWFPKINSRFKDIVVIKKSTGICLFELRYTISHDGEKSKKSGRFFVYDYPDVKNIYLIVFLEEDADFKRSLLTLVYNLYPRLLLTFIAQKKLKELVEYFNEQHHFDKLTITRASLRTRFEGESKKEKIIKSVSWPQINLNDAFELAHQNNGWFHSIDFEAKRSPHMYANISMSRQGVVKTNSFLEQVVDSFIDPICKNFRKEIDLYAHRSRSENKLLSVRPLTIEFGSDYFSKVEDNAKFIQAMKMLKKSSVSVLHGNPYIHLSVIDYFDGSVFDLWVLTSNELFIVPQMQGTVPAIKRLINHIFDTYAEGEIKNYQESLI